MIKLLRKLLGLCNHEWKLIDKQTNKYWWSYTDPYPVQVKVFYTYKCNICSKLKTKIVKM